MRATGSARSPAATTRRVRRAYRTGAPRIPIARSRCSPLLSSEQLAELAEALRGPAPDGDDWIGRTVPAWISAKLGRPVSVYLGWAYLVRLEGKRRRPRPRHVQADPVAQETFKKAETAAARGGDRLSAGAGRTLGHR